MKVSPKILALMAAMAAGIAGAAPTANTTNTPAGQSIENTATANYTDPSGNPGTSTSNTVTTKVLPLPAFDITYQDGTQDGQTNNSANSATDKTPTSYYTPDAKPSQPIDKVYSLVNNGNTPIVVHITPDVTNLTAGDVKYTFGTLPTGAAVSGDINAGYDVTLPQGQVINFTQTITVPAGATPGTIVGASPVGVAYATKNTDNGVPSDMQENQTVVNGAVTGPSAKSDEQFQAAKVYTPDLTNNPNGSPDGSTTTVTTTITPPGSTTTTTGYTPDPTTPAGTGSTSPTPIKIDGDNQIAYPPADRNTDNDVVTFTNNVHNSGTLPDSVNLFPTDGTGNPIGTKNADGSFTFPNGVTVKFLDPSTGQPLPLSPDGYPTVTVQPGGNAPYLTQVTYPDSDSKPNQTPIVITVGVDSGLDSGVVSDNTTTDTIMPPAAQFGDTSALTTGPLAVNPSPTPENTVTPNTAVTTPTNSPAYPMTVANTGTYDDSYKLAGAVPIKLNDGSTVVVPVNYAGATIDPAFKGDPTAPLSTTQTAGTSPVVVNGTTYYAPTYTTPVVPANSPSTGITATVPVPYNAAMTTGTTGTNPEPKLQQTAQGVYSTIPMTDTNDLLKISPTGNVVVGKFTQTTDGQPAANTQYAVNGANNTTTVTTTAPAAGVVNVTNPAGYNGLSGEQANTKYLPQKSYNYQIIAKNGYNSDISNFVLSDPLNTNLTLNNFTCSAGGVSSSPVPVDAQGRSVPTCTYASLAAGATATMTVNVTIK